MLAKSRKLTYPVVFKKVVGMSICLIRSLKHFPTAACAGAVTLGNFDGMHLGHQALLQKTVAVAKKIASPSLVITFHPYPAEYFTDKQSFVRLSTLRDKLALMQAIGIEYVVLLHFNQSIANLPAQDFLKTILIDTLKVKHIIVGDDFHFGHQRQGNVALLKTMEKVG